MKFVTLSAKPSDVRPIQLEMSREIAYAKSVGKHAARITAYASIISLALWISFVFPDLNTGFSTFEGWLKNVLGLQEKYVKMAIFLFSNTLGCLLVPVLHELLHLAAMPHRAWHENTTVALFRNGFLGTALFVQIGGRLSKNNFIWISLFPLLTLSLAPALWLLSSTPETRPPLFIGFMACVNLGLSTTDIFHAFQATRMPKILRE